jgi:multiple sugar transport system substrate-binding protein
MKVKNCAYLMLGFLVFLALSCREKEEKTQGTAAQAQEFVFRRKPTAGITFLSTQMNPVEEAGKMRNVILKDFPGRVDFRPNDNSFLFTQISAILKEKPNEPILVGALHGDIVRLYEENSIRPLNDVYKGLGEREFPENLMKLSRLDGRDVYYIPWMQASFVMVANKKALPYLPKGAEVNSLTYEQLLQWSKAIFEKSGKKALGFPAGEKGLMHRFFQGYLYPSFTASTLLRFRSQDAQGMWAYFRTLWSFVHQSSIVYSTMSDPLLIEDVWIAWDHTARLVKAFEEKPDDFIAFPAPTGPKGRGFMPVISGLSIPKEVSDTENPAMLIDYLTQPAIQSRTLRETGFFPVVSSTAENDTPRNLKELSAAVDRQANSSESLPALLPIGLGERGSDYNQLFMLTFSEIVLEGGDIKKVLDTKAKEMQTIIDEQNLSCWLPDISNERPCKIE